jgi:hypothetical protein
LDLTIPPVQFSGTTSALLKTRHGRSALGDSYQFMRIC